MQENLKRELAEKACRIRMGVIEGTFHAKSGHPGGSLSIADVLAYLYFRELRLDPKNPKWDDRDRFVLSKGHCAPALYAALALRGYFSCADSSFCSDLPFYPALLLPRLCSRCLL